VPEELEILPEIIFNDSDAVHEVEMFKEVVKEVVEEVVELSPAVPKFARVICHQCGALFSGTNPACRDFRPGDPGQEGFCREGEVGTVYRLRLTCGPQACLWYSWQKTAEVTAVVRECFSPLVLLGR
jgi:hypothetical protein